MLTDWMYWILSIPHDQLVLMFLPFLLLDGVRYTVMTVGMCLFDIVSDGIQALFGRQTSESFEHCPSVTVMIVGLNEGATIEYALSSIYDTYPRMDIIVVSDGSTDGMQIKAQQFARKYPGVTVLHRRLRGGKSSAMNMALPLISSEIVVVLDSDSQLDDNAIWRIVQPFSEPSVGAVSGCVSARNPMTNLCTYMQGLEYRRSIFIGRILLARLNILGIVSGALGAFRKSALDQIGGWDVGPGEDGDLTLKLRKSGYRIAYEPSSNCLTNVPEKWWTLIRQRRRWEWAAITLECRKHIDLGNPRYRHFEWTNFLMVAERWLFSFLMVYASVFYMAWLLVTLPFNTLFNLVFTFYIGYVFCDFLQFMVLLYYSPKKPMDMKLIVGAPLMPFYMAFQKLITLWAITEELLFRRSYKDNFVPERVRQATWHW